MTTNPRILLATFVLALIVALAVHLLEFPGSVPDFEKQSAGGVLLDAKPSFSEDGIYDRIEGYGERGRANYAFRNVTVDILLPLSVLPFLILLMRDSTRRLQPRRATQTLLLSLPIAYVVFDLAENASVLVLLAQYPERLTFLAAVLPYLTVVKRGASLLAIAIPLVILALVFFRRRLRRAVGT
jgi:hypothetical protein